MTNFLLVEQNFPIPGKSRNHKGFCPIGLLKIGSYIQKKYKVNNIVLIRGMGTPDFVPDEIWITSLFTYWSNYFWESVEYYRNQYPRSIIRIGGIYVSLHFDKSEFKQKCKKNKVKPHFGLFQKAEKCFPDYSLLNNNSCPLNYQIIHSTRGCERHCSFCYTWKLEQIPTSKQSIINEIKTNKLVFYDNNLLKNKYIDELLSEIAEYKWNGKVVHCESQSGFDGRILEKQPELAFKIKKARFENPKIAWDWDFDQWKSIKKQIDILKKAGYHSKTISIFMIFNWKIPFLEMEKKRLKCFKWKVQITDCRYRPIDQTFDRFNSRKKQTSEDYYIHPKWTDAEIKQFRKNIRRQNICVRHNFIFHSKYLERKDVPKEESMRLRYLPKQQIKKRIPDAWYPNKIHKPKKSL